MDCSIQGFNEIKVDVDNVKKRRITYAVFEINELNPVILKTIATGGLNTSVNVKAKPSFEELKSIFQECKENLKANMPSFVVYNFGYYIKSDNYREMLLFISFIPETANVKYKMAMASNLLTLQGNLEVSKPIEIHELQDFDHDSFKTLCSEIQRL